MFPRFFSLRYGDVSGFVNALMVLVLLTFALPGHPASAATLRVVVLGDSLSAGYGLMLPDAFPSQLQRALSADGFDVEIINAGVSGDTSAGGLSRLDWALSEGADAVIIELGANDGLRGLEPGETGKNIDAIVTSLKQRGLAILLTGMRAPPNLGADYGRAFAAIYPRLAEKHGIALYPFFLQGVAAIPALNQEDTIHPNPKGVKVVIDGILPYVKEMLRGIKVQ